MHKKQFKGNTGRQFSLDTDMGRGGQMVPNGTKSVAFSKSSGDRAAQ